MASSLPSLIRRTNKQLREMSKETKYVSRHFDEFQDLSSKSFGVRPDPKTKINIYTSRGMNDKEKNVLKDELETAQSKRWYDVTKLHEAEERWNKRREERLKKDDFGEDFGDRFETWEAEKTFYDYLDAVTDDISFYYSKAGSKEYIYNEWKKGSNIYDVQMALKNEEHSLAIEHPASGKYLGW